MTIESLIAAYGLPAIFLGAGIEGETVAVLGGVVAHAGTLPLWQVFAAVGLGSFLADEIFFAKMNLGRPRNFGWTVEMRTMSAVRPVTKSDPDRFRRSRRHQRLT